MAQQPSTDILNPLTTATHISTVRQAWVFPPVDEPVTEQPAEEPILQPVEEKLETPVAENTVSSGKVFYIIAGVFWKEPNAEKYAAQLTQKGYKAEVIDSDCVRCKRVSLGAFNTKAEAEAFLRQVQASINAEAWILAGR